MFGMLINAVTSPVKAVADMAEGLTEGELRTEKLTKIITQPVVDILDVLEGLSEGELRTKAINTQCVDGIVGLGFSEIMELMSDE